MKLNPAHADVPTPFVPVLTSEVARILSCSAETVRNKERAGVLTAIRTPTGVRIFNRLDVERLANQRAANSPTPRPAASRTPHGGASMTATITPVVRLAGPDAPARAEAAPPGRPPADTEAQRAPFILRGSPPAPERPQRPPRVPVSIGGAP